MKNITNNLSNLNSPWNCPHGRPTMIKLPNLKNLDECTTYRNITPVNYDM